MAEVVDVVAAAEPDRGEAGEALGRVVRSAWRTLGRYHALVAINTQQDGHADLHAKHHAVLAKLAPLIARGQADGRFRADISVAWHLSMLLALVHAASGELQAGRITAADGEPLKVPGIIPKLSHTPGAIRTPAPRLGEHTDEVLREIGYSDTDIARLRQANIL
jgi:hypothetical protein